MRKILLATVSVVALAAPAVAADLAMAPAPAAPEPMAVVMDWNGFFVGANAGFGGGNFDYNAYITGSPHKANASITSSGWFAGGQAGYNWQMSPNFVLGAVTDIQWSDVKGELTLGTNLFGGNLKANAGSTVDWFGTTRLRAGWATGPFMLYGTGGIAYGDVSANLNVNHHIANLSQSDSAFGWAAGAGVEYKVTRNISLNTEWLYVDLGSQNLLNINANPLSPHPVTGNHRLKLDQDTAFNTVKLGVNYHW